MNTLDAVYIVTEKENFPIIEKTGQIPMASVEEAWQAARERLKKGASRTIRLPSCPMRRQRCPFLR